MSHCKHLQKHAREALAAIQKMLPKGWSCAVTAGRSTHYHFEIFNGEVFAGRVVLAASPRVPENEVIYAKQKTRKILGGGD